MEVKDAKEEVKILKIKYTKNLKTTTIIPTLNYLSQAQLQKLLWLKKSLISKK